MRWPLKYQIMAPMTVIMLGTILAVSMLQAYTAARQMRQRTATRLRHVTSTLASSPGFSLKGNVLQQMKGLAGAEFVLLDRRGHVQGTTREDWRDDDLSELPIQDLSPGFLAQPVTLAGSRWYHGRVSVRPRGPGRQDLTLHVFYPEDVYLREQRAAMYPALVIGSLAIVLVVLLAQWTASRVSRPLDQLRHQVHAISQGQFQTMALPSRNDEVRDLTRAVNHLTKTLKRYEQQVRRAEQNRLLAQLGGGLRTPAAQCSHGCPDGVGYPPRRVFRSPAFGEPRGGGAPVGTDRGLPVSVPVLGHCAEPKRSELVKLDSLIGELLPLVQPAARHMGVQLDVQMPEQPLELYGDRVTLGHLVMNLLTNAIEAAGQQPGGSGPQRRCARTAQRVRHARRSDHPDGGRHRCRTTRRAEQYAFRSVCDLQERWSGVGPGSGPRSRPRSSWGSPLGTSDT